MIKKYVIDGNNLIGKIPELFKLQQTEKQSSREKLAYKLDRYFHGKKVKVTLHFDGHPQTAIRTNKLRIEYSENRPADDLIRHEISIAKNPRTLAVVSSDHSVYDFARVNACTPIKSEDFARQIDEGEQTKTEEDIIKGIDNEEIKKLFGL